MRRAKDAGTLLAPVAVAAVALACCAGLPALAATFAGLTLVTVLGLGGDLLAPRGGRDPASAAPSLLRAERGEAVVTVEVLYFDGCPNHEALLPRLRELLAQASLPTEVELRRITDDEAAQRERFLGSPTVRVDGHDIEPDAERRTDYGLKCRLYRTSDGLSGRPPDEWLQAALNGAGH